MNQRKTILAVDYGRKKLGVALSQGPLADPLTVLRGDDRETLLKKFLDICRVYRPALIIVGVSEGIIADEAKIFGKDIEFEAKTKVKYFDETLSTFDAKVMSIEANIKRKKRKEMEDAYSAAIFLQKYLDQEI